jgi:hypothetical protein
MLEKALPIDSIRLPFAPSSTLEYVGNRILLLDETPLPDVLKQAPLLVPAADGRQVLGALCLTADIAHLDDDYPSQRDGPGGEDDIAVEFTRGTLDTVADVLNQARRGERVERAEQK